MAFQKNTLYVTMNCKNTVKAAWLTNREYTDAKINQKHPRKKTVIPTFQTSGSGKIQS